MSSSESDSDEISPEEISLSISPSDAIKNYNEAGVFVPEEAEQINFETHGHLIDHANDKILDSVLADVNLPYKLADFQTTSLHTIFQKKDLVLISPTGSGKGNTD